MNELNDLKEISKLASNIKHALIQDYNNCEYPRTIVRVSTTSSQGDNLIIWIPKEFHKDANQLKGKQVKILIDNNI